ncbi:MAG: M16 family metallopeptidase [Alphaproteobacteria bacterium]
MMLPPLRFLTPFFIILPFMLAFSITANAESDTKFLDIQTVQSDSGVTAWLVEDHSIPVIAMQVAFRGAGSKTDPQDKQGRARLASNTMDEGAGDMDAQSFQKALRDHSITLAFQASRDHYSAQLKTLTHHKDEALSLLKLALTEPRFDDDAVERMRASNLSRIRTSLSNPRWMAARIQNDRIFAGHPYAHNSGGTLSTLAQITQHDLRAFHKTLGKNQVIIGVSGDITPEELKVALDDVFGGMPDAPETKEKRFTIQNSGQTYLYEQDIPQTVIEIAQEGIDRNDPDYYAAVIMNFILGESGFGSRLMEEIREKRGLTYGIYSYFRSYREADVLHVSTSTVNKSVPEMLNLIREQWDTMKNTPVTDKELQEAQSYLQGSLPLSLTSTDSIASVITSLQLDNLPMDYLDVRNQKIQAVTIEDIQNVSKRLLHSEKLTIVLVGSPPEGDAQINDVKIIKSLPNAE